MPDDRKKTFGGGRSGGPTGSWLRGVFDGDRKGPSRYSLAKAFVRDTVLEQIIDLDTRGPRHANIKDLDQALRQINFKLKERNEYSQGHHLIYAKDLPSYVIIVKIKTLS